MRRKAKWGGSKERDSSHKILQPKKTYLSTFNCLSFILWREYPMIFIHVKELGKSEYIIVRKWQLVRAGAAAGVRVRSGWVYCANVSCHHIEVHNKMAPLYNGWLMTRARAESLICPAWPGLNTHQATEIRALGVSSWLWSSPRDRSVNTNILSQDIKDPLSTSQSQ